jgi:uncharacterized Zn finger protein (UPF0148 family)
MFKEKKSKKKQILSSNKNHETTLDEKHKQMISTIESQIEKKDILLKQKAEYEKEKTKLSGLITEYYNSNINEGVEYNMIWDSNIYLSDKLQEIDKKISLLNDAEYEIEYYENTGTILFDYYELLNQQENNNISSANNTVLNIPKPQSKCKSKMLPINQKNILEAFKVPNEDDTDEDNSDIEDEIPKESSRDKTTLVHEYLLAIDNNYMKTLNDSVTNTCERCSLTMNCLAQEGLIICPNCGYQELLLVEQNRPIYKQANKEASHYTYKRINHFNEWISQIQGKESTDIPEEIFEKIANEIKKEKIKDLSKLSYNKMREILKKINTNKYYEHIYYIIYRLNGIPAPDFSPELEEKLRSMFKEIQGPFLKYCPSNRKNFLSYSYVLYKFCELLEKDEYLKYFSLLKSREKLHLQDQIWKQICEDVNWEFIQSI